MSTDSFRGRLLEFDSKFAKVDKRFNIVLYYACTYALRLLELIYITSKNL